jgi:hypothetical protein
MDSHNLQKGSLLQPCEWHIKSIKISHNQCDRYVLPKAFTSKVNKKSYSKIFIFNIRGHDFLSHCGQWTDSSGRGGYLEEPPTATSEPASLEPLRADNAQKNGSNGSDMIISFGPQSSSFFADVNTPNLKRYMWQNLPDGLNYELQNTRGYRSIYDVMNPDGSGKRDHGWVFLFKEKEKFREKQRLAFGGALPPRLKELLQEAE